MNENDLQERKAFLEEVEAFLSKSDYLTVLGLAEARLKRTPGDLDSRIVICRVWIEQGRLEEAGEMLLEMEDILASLSQIYTCMGDIYLKKGMPESAQVFYRTFVSLNPDTTMAREISERLKGVSEQHATDDGARTEKEEAAQVPDDFQTVTLAELYVRQGHLQMAEEVLEAVLRKGPHHAKAAEMLREVREKIVSRKESEKYAPVIAELSRWLNNIGRLSSHAA
jgi:thioredoxin-like negative regulator of GroEL